MRLNLLEPNAHYDMVHGMPSKIENGNDGSFLYRYNIEPEMGIPDGQEEEVQIGWQCREIRIWSTPTKSVLKKAIIRSIVDDCAEFEIINSYNKHVLEIRVDLTAVDNYREYLEFIDELDTMLVSDLSS